jgi:ABC-type transporter Mla subunit MlaD
MAEAETLVRVLEGLIAGQTRLGEMIQTVHERAEAKDLALARLIENQGQALARLIENQGQALTQTLQNVTQALQVMMQALERIVSTTDRTERMTTEVLARLAPTQGTSQ